jgi:hypothetical protein
VERAVKTRLVYLQQCLNKVGIPRANHYRAKSLRAMNVFEGYD